MNDGLADALEKASINAGALEQILTDGGDAVGAAQADQAENDLLIAAQQVNAKNAMQKLGTTQTNQQRLQAVVNGMDAATARIARQEKNVQKFVSLATDAGHLAAALALVPPNIAAGIAAVKSIAATLNIH
jgi:hypothetical protein